MFITLLKTLKYFHESIFKREQYFSISKDGKKTIKRPKTCDPDFMRK